MLPAWHFVTRFLTFATTFCHLLGIRSPFAQSPDPGLPSRGGTAERRGLTVLQQASTLQAPQR